MVDSDDITTHFGDQKPQTTQLDMSQINKSNDFNISNINEHDRSQIQLPQQQIATHKTKVPQNSKQSVQARNSQMIFR